jgi:hypothetical protein
MKIWIFGRTKANNKDIINKSEEIWKIIALEGHTVVTGWTEGYPHIVALSAIKSWWKAIAYITGCSLSDHLVFHNTDLTSYSDIIFQDRYCNKKLSGIDNYLRSLDMCLNVDLAIIIGWRVGTMYEITILSWMWKDMYILNWSWWITWETIKKFIIEWHKEKSKIVFFDNLNKINLT